MDSAIPHAFDLRAFVLLTALIADSALPDWRFCWRHLPHPVVVFGHAIAFAERHLNNRRRMRGKTRRPAGGIAMVILITAAMGAAMLIMYAATALSPIAAMITEAFLVMVMLAANALPAHVRPVADALARDDIPAARKALARLVGRDTANMDKAAIARAAIETTAENLSDGIIAPALAYLAFGLPGIFAYKMINTADSMTGYRNPRYYAYGWAAARLDDIANLIPARLTACLLALATPRRFLHILRIAWRDGQNHPSPNAGLPMAAMAAGLNTALGGVRHYGGRKTDYGMFLPEGDTATPTTITRALNMMWRGVAVFAIIIAIIAAAGFL